MYLDLLGPVESHARTPFRRVDGPYGSFLMMKPEDLLLERVLVSFYPQKDPAAREWASDHIAVILTGVSRKLLIAKDIRMAGAAGLEPLRLAIHNPA